MSQVLVYPDVELLLITYLREELATRSINSRVGSRIPAPQHGRLVRITRTGGLADDILPIDRTQLTFEVYADRTEEAHDLAQLVRGLIHALRDGSTDGVAVYGVTEFAGPQETPDPLTDKPRWTFTVQVSVRGAPEST